MKLRLRAAVMAFMTLLCACGGKSDSEAMNEPLSSKGLDPTDEYFVFELADRVAEKVEIDGTPESADRLNALPEHWRYIEPLMYYYNQVNNGGHHQYFWNSQGVYRHLVEEGLKHYQADGYIENFADCLAIYRPEDYEVTQGATYEAYNEAYKEDRYDKQDTRFYKTAPDLAQVVSDAIRNSLDEYK